MSRSFFLFLRFFQRDFFVYKKQLRRFFVNFSFLRPLFYSFSFAYIQANIIFISQQTKFVTILLAGNMVLILMVISFTLAAPLLFDFEEERFIDYQISILRPHLVILERILFSSLFCFVVMLPFFPMAKLILRTSFDTTHTSWSLVFLISYLGSLCCCAFHYLIVCAMKGSEYLPSLWMRIEIPLLILGGYIAPLHTILKLWPTFGYIVFLNPYLYVAEGFRSAILGTSEYLSISACAAGLIGFSILFTLLTFYFFRKKTDHI